MVNCLFCDFVSGRRKFHTNKIPFQKIHETPNTLSFLSIDFIANENGHTLVIPKKHFTFFEEIPAKLSEELFSHIALISNALKKNNSGCNILLNNGKHAGQFIPHADFHIIPRNKGDKIIIEKWKSKKT